MALIPADYDWSDIAFSSKRSLQDVKAIFIPAPREISTERFIQLIKKYLPNGNILLGIAKESYIEGFDDQPQFKTLQLNNIQTIIDKVNRRSKNKIFTINYFQRELEYILKKVKFNNIVLVNGSWKYTFHTQAPYYVIANKKMNYEFVSPFTNENEAKFYETNTAKKILKEVALPPIGSLHTSEEMLDISNRSARCSYDYNFQTGVALGKLQSNGKYRLLAYTHNKVVPYETYAMHFGASRELHYSPPHDLNHYDTVHAEVELIIRAMIQKINLKGTTVFINLLPCPPCSRMLSETPLSDIVYSEDHSGGYAIQLLEAAGKTVRRVIV